MRKSLVLVVVVLCFGFFAVAASAAEEEMYSIKGPVVSVDAAGNSVRVNSVEGPATGAENRWKGEMKFEVGKKTKIMMAKKQMKLGDLKTGDVVKVKFRETKDGKLIADEIKMSDKDKMMKEKMMQEKMMKEKK